MAERLVLPLTDGGTVRLLLYWHSDASPPVAVQSYHRQPGKESLLERALADPAYEKPTYKRPLPEPSTITLWRARSRDPRRRELLWFQSLAVREYGEAKLWTIEEERPLDILPAWVTKTPHHHVLWFEFGDGPNGGRALLRFMDQWGEVWHKTDLRALGRFRSGEEARQELLWQAPRTQKGPDWIPLAQGQNYGLRHESVELWDKRKRRYLFVIERSGSEMRVQEEASEGLAARRPQELRFAGERIATERAHYSPNKRFKLRMRWFEPAGEYQKGARTLLAIVGSGTHKQEVELWSEVSYDEPTFAYVTDSGRVYRFNFEDLKDSSSGKTFKRAIFSGRAPDGEGIFGHDLVSDGGYPDADEAKRGVRWKEVEIRPEGRPVRRVVHGVPIVQWPVERLTLRHRDGGSPTRMWIERDPRTGRDAMFYVRGWPPGARPADLLPKRRAPR